MCQLIKKKVDLEIVDKNGKSPLQLAVDGADADVVTLLVDPHHFLIFITS